MAESSPRAEWVRVASLSREVFADPADYMAVQRSLAECTGLSGQCNARTIRKARLV